MKRRTAALILLVFIAAAAWLLSAGLEVTRPEATSPEATSPEATSPEATSPDATLGAAGRGEHGAEGRVPPQAAGTDAPSLHAAGQAAPRSPVPARPLQGRVVDAASTSGLAGVRLYCVAQSRRGVESPQPLKAMSGAGGAFSLRGLTPGTWLIVPFHKDYTHAFLTGLFRGHASTADLWRHGRSKAWAKARDGGLVFDVANDGALPATVEIQLRPGALIRGRVLGPGGVPVSGAPIRVHIPYYSPWTEVGSGVQGAIHTLTLTDSDARGQFELSCFQSDLTHIRLGAGDARLIGRWSEPLDLVSGEPIELRLFEPATAEGLVRWSDGRPEAEATVRVEADRLWIVADETSWSKSRWVSTDARGQFRLERLPPGAVELRAHAAEGWEANADHSLGDLRPGEARTGVVLTLNDRQWIRGVLVDAEGQPLAHEYLVARGPGDEEPRLDSDWTDDDGRFALEITEDVLVVLKLETGDRDERLVGSLRPPLEDLRVVAIATPQATIRVRVLDPQGKPIPTFGLRAGSGRWLRRASERPADGVGSVRVQGAAPYRYLVSAPRDAEGKSLPYAPYGAELASAPSATIEVRLAKTAEFYGRILDRGDHPVPGVGLWIKEGEGEREVSVAEDGRFRFKAADPNTREIEGGRLVLPKGYRDSSYVTGMRAGQHEDIRVRGGGLAIGGRIVLEGAEPGVLGGLGIAVSWTSRDHDEDDDSLQTVTSADGRFVVYALPADARVTVSVHAFSLAQRGMRAVDPPVTAPAGTTDLRLRVRLGQSIAGRVEGPGVSALDYRRLRACILPWHGTIVSFFGQTPPQPGSNTFRIAGLSQGKHRVALMDRQGPDRLLGWVGDIAAGRDDVVLQLPRLDGVIEGRISLEGLKAVGRIDVRVMRLDGSNFVMQGEAAADGRFRFDRLNSRGVYAVSADVQAGETLHVAALANVKPGQPVELKPQPALQIRGHVADQGSGEGVIGLIATTDGIYHFASCDREDGTFTFRGLPAGEYTVTPLGPGFVRGTPVTGVKAGSADVSIPGR